MMLTGLAQARQPQQFSNADCLACHSDPSLTMDVNGKQVSLQVNEDKFKASMHGQMLNCVDCHKGIKSLPHDANVSKPTCAQCHADEQKTYDKSIHAQAIAAGNSNAATCESCHGNIHELLPPSDPNSKVNHANIPKTCGACHGQKFVMETSGVTTTPVMNYQQSVHGKLSAEGNDKAAVCTDCHGAHDIMGPGNPQSPIFKTNVPKTCGKCHGSEAAQYSESIHGQAVARGNLHAPVCTDCHGIHSIKRPQDPTATVNAQNLATEVCGQCHSGVTLTREFGVPGNRLSSYQDSYHGLAHEMGSTKVANCASCHGVHDILPSSDPRSTINKANLVKTCGQCHPGANENFTKGKIHLSDDPPQAAETKILAFIRRFYLLMIWGTIGFMVLHNLIILRKKLADRLHGHAHVSGGPRIVTRMTKLQQIQHLSLFVSFIVLVLTGFSLKYPNSGLAMMFINESVRSLVHRIAGSILIATSLFHIFYVIRYKEGRKMWRDMLPEPKDATDMVDVFAYYLGFSNRKPQFKRFNYAEKMEYWALVWGTFVMGATGFMMWFQVFVGDRVPRWWVDVATTIHWYEAILATLAIIVWHFYMIIFDPDSYPMNWAWFDGKVSLEHYREEHPLDYETLSAVVMEDEPPAEQIVDAPQEKNNKDSAAAE